MTTDWVLAGKCSNLPLIYQWRILETATPVPISAEQTEEFENEFRYWDGSLAARKRLEQIQNSSAHILLFLEYIPHTLYQWLGRSLQRELTKN